MHLSRIRIYNFRNFSELDVTLQGNVVVVGENRVGKSNLLYALCLIFDPTLPDASRHLSLSDFWDSLGPLDKYDTIIISVEIRDFDDDLDVLAILTDFRLNDDPGTVRLTYEFRPRGDLEGDPCRDEDYEFICYGGEDEAKVFGYDLRRRITMEFLPALRDAEGDLGTWRRSPLRPLIEQAFASVDRADLEKVGGAVESATKQMTEFDAIKALEQSIGELFAKMSGPRHDVKPSLGFASTDATRLYRNIRLLIDQGMRGIHDASLGSANLIFLTLKALQLNQMLEENKHDHTILAIEEPEAHLHPHLQRSVYRHIFESIGGQDSSLSVFLTTHSPHVASVAPLRSILLLRETAGGGSIGRSTASLQFDGDEIDDLARYLDVTRAEILFARGVVLVEGDAERFLVPEFAKMLKKPLDPLGVTVCSVGGTNFQPYAKFLTGLEIPFSIVTDWDPREGKVALGYNRTLNLVKTIETVRLGHEPTELIAELKEIEDVNDFCERCEQFGIFSNVSTLETDLFSWGYADIIIETLREAEFGPERTKLIDEWQADNEKLDRHKFLAMVEDIGKGRFAQRLAARMAHLSVPAYIDSAICFVADRV